MERTKNFPFEVQQYFCSNQRNFAVTFGRKDYQQNLENILTFNKKKDKWSLTYFVSILHSYTK